MSLEWKTQGTIDGPFTPAHRAALAEWSRLLATGALPEPADEQVTAGPTILRHQFGGYPGPGLDLPAYRCRREFRRRRLARLALWLVRKAAREAREAALLTLGMLALRWDWLRAQPRPALVALGLVVAALLVGWVSR